MKIEKEHSKTTLMNWTKEQLAEHVMCLEHNNNVLHENNNIQYENITKLLEAFKEHGIYVNYNTRTMKFNVELKKEELKNEKRI
ncbi:MAG: hypothetical protein RSE50_12710 [Myroides sp.]